VNALLAAARAPMEVPAAAIEELRRRHDPSGHAAALVAGLGLGSAAA